MPVYRKFKKYYYIDFFIEIFLKVSGLSCRNFSGKKKNMFLFLYSSSIVFVSIYYTIFGSKLITSGDTTDEIIETLMYCFNVTNITVTYWSNVLNEKTYWRIRSDLKNLDLDHDKSLEKKKYKYYIISTMICIIFVCYMLYLMLLLSPFTAQLALGRLVPFLLVRFFTNHYCSMSTCRIARLLSLIETKYVLLNSQYENFDETANLMSDFRHLIGMHLNIDEIRLDLLKKYKKIHLDLGNAVKDVEKQFALGLLVDISRGFYLVYFGTYWTVQEFYNGDGKRIILQLHITLSVSLQIIKIIVLASVCSGIEDENNESKLRVDQIMENCNTAEMEKEIMSLAEQLRDPVYISACGMFNINYSLLLQMAGGYLTNIVLILQLRFPGLL